MTAFAVTSRLTATPGPCCHDAVTFSGEKALDWDAPPRPECDRPGRLECPIGDSEGCRERMYHPDLIRHPDACPALVLNADYTPLSYYPLSLWPWQTAVKAVFLERVDIVAQYVREVHSPTRTFQLPSVIALRQYVKPSEHPAFTRFNLFLRDRFQCQYCTSPAELTFDHVVPRAQGGRTTWENVATACAPCNLRKGGRTPAEAHMNLNRRPWRPTSWQLQENGRSFPPGYLHESWRDYLYWDVELEA